MQHFTQHAPRGEFTLVIAGHADASWGVGDRAKALTSTVPVALDADAIRQRLQALVAAGHSSSAAARLLSRELGIPKGTIYDIGLGEDEEP